MKNALKQKRIKEIALACLGLFAAISLIAFVDDKSKIRRCQELKVDLLDFDKQSYISADDIAKYITKDGLNPLKGRILADIDLSKLEDKVNEINQVEYCEAYGDLQGNIHVKVKPYVPYARVISGNGNDLYINENGKYFPLSKYHSARVLLLSGDYFNKRPDLEGEDQDYMSLVHYIRSDNFWDAQIAQIDVDAKGDIRFVPLLGNHIIEFGRPDDIEAKLAKLKIYYKQIMPVKGWDKFSKVKIQYQNQVVCE